MAPIGFDLVDAGTLPTSACPWVLIVSAVTGLNVESVHFVGSVIAQYGIEMFWGSGTEEGKYVSDDLPVQLKL
jgi:hypothetical protein